MLKIWGILFIMGVYSNKTKGVSANMASEASYRIEDIDFSELMDLRVDYAFKRIFGEGEDIFLISLLNAIFESKKLPRVIRSLTVANPFLEKQSKGDKLSILDIRAELDDGAIILVEMHLYGIDEIKYKTIRSWARTYGEELKESELYSKQPPVICVTFANGSLDGTDSGKIHKCCKIMDIDDSTVFSDALELHYIDMKAFVRAINETDGIEKGETLDSMLAKWLAVITEKDIKDKGIIRGICEEKEEISMVVSTLARLSEDKLVRQAYQRRQDDVVIFNIKERRAEEDRRRAKEDRRRAEIAERRAEMAETALAGKDTEIELLKRQLAMFTRKQGD
ncbi:MAG: Rpn family recombination-promoting nuclease/putative transposase [Defluviitaleaceae bacterium]|nr:Rpn family recombination-promoting nuclease/putative transposase [Defluviitaleaceae bacterium]